MSSEGAAIETVGRVETGIIERLPQTVGKVAMPEEAKKSYFVARESSLPSSQVLPNQLVIAELADTSAMANEVLLD